MSDDPFRDYYVRAVSEEAKAEVRAKNLVCPPCRVNMADLPQDHWLTINGMIATCTSQSLVAVDLVKSGTLQCAVNIDMWQRVLRDALYGDGFTYEVDRNPDGNVTRVRGLSPLELAAGQPASRPVTRGRQYETDQAAASHGVFYERLVQPWQMSGPPFVHTWTPSEPPRRRWWQFWRRNRGHWLTHTFTEGKS